MPAFPLWLRIAVTAYVAILVPAYWQHYGPVNFLWFCDVALFLTVAALWAPRPLLASSQALAVLVPEAVWLLDLALKLVADVHLIGMTEYMFDPAIPPLVRVLSLFHVWLPPLLVWMIWQHGYDRRALPAQTALGTLVLLAAYLLTPAEVNINRVHRLGSIGDPWALAIALVGCPLLFYLPVHVALQAAAPLTPRSDIR